MDLACGANAHGTQVGQASHLSRSFICTHDRKKLVEHGLRRHVPGIPPAFDFGGSRQDFGFSKAPEIQQQTEEEKRPRTHETRVLGTNNI